MTCKVFKDVLHLDYIYLGKKQYEIVVAGEDKYNSIPCFHIVTPKIRKIIYSIGLFSPTYGETNSKILSKKDKECIYTIMNCDIVENVSKNKVINTTLYKDAIMFWNDLNHDNKKYLNRKRKSPNYNKLPY